MLARSHRDIRRAALPIKLKPEGFAKGGKGTLSRIGFGGF